VQLLLLVGGMARSLVLVSVVCVVVVVVVTYVGVFRAALFAA